MYKFLTFYAENYIGLYAKLSLSNINIDFSKCKTNIIKICAPNGYGKSSLLDIMHILPESSSFILPKKQGKKGGILISEENQYKWEILYPINGNGNREGTKAYIYKMIDGKYVDMNKNGNVTSYREYVESEFNFDPAFSALTYLSISNKGIVSKTPSERKRYMNTVLKEVEAYNQFLKTLNKRRSAANSILKNIVSKINYIGEEKDLILSLESINNRLNQLFKDKDQKLQELAELKSKVKLLDPDGFIQEKYNLIYKNIININSQISDKENSILKMSNKLSAKINIENVESFLSKLKEETNNSKYKVSRIELDIQKQLDNKERESKELQDKIAKLDSMKLDISDDINIKIRNAKTMIKEYEVIINKIGLKDPFSISKDEFIQGVESLYEIKNIVENVRSIISPDIISKAIQKIQSNDLSIDIDGILSEISTLKDKKSNLYIELNRYETLLKETDVLKNRDPNCIINTCPFIRSAIEAQLQQPEKNISIITNDLSDIDNNIKRLNNLLSYNRELKSTINLLLSVCNSLKSNLFILKKLPLDMNIFGDKNYILNAIDNSYDFKEINYLYEYIEYADIIEEYKIQVNNLSILEKDYQIYLEKNKILEEIRQEIKRISSNVDSISKEIEDNKLELQNQKTFIAKANRDIFILEDINNIIKEKELLKNEKTVLINEYNNIKNNMQDIKESIDKINKLDKEIKFIEKSISPINSDRDKLNHSLAMTREYKAEYEIFKAKINKIDILKKYCNPNEEGIQLLFIELYFHNSIKLANELLQLIFDGEYRIEKPIITGDEFKIPVIGNNLPCDDVSSMSESQKSMIGVILSLVLAFQSSGKIIIPRLDEIDESLDFVNRTAYTNLLVELKDRLNLEQIIFVSHNNEFNLNNTDLILLYDKEEDKTEYRKYNIIYEI